MKLKQKYIDKELSHKIFENVNFKPIRFSKKVFDQLFEQYKEYGMGEYYYCCFGIEQSCWTEVIEEGVWELTLPDVKQYITRRIHECKKYLYNMYKYGNRYYYYHDGVKDIVHIYIFGRDVVGCDCYITFHNESR